VRRYFCAAPKRGKKYRVSGYFQGKRIRASLGTASVSSADVWKEKIKRALESGADSPLWPELQRLLPPQTFRMLARVVGYEEKTAPIVPVWIDLVAAVKARDEQRIQLGTLALSTKARYDQTLASFTTFLGELTISELRQITRPMVENYKVWRLAKIREKRFSRGGTGVTLDAAILHRTLHFVIESEMIEKNWCGWKAARVIRRIAVLSRSMESSSAKCGSLPELTFSPFCCCGGPA
jgi:hypothetical protein